MTTHAVPTTGIRKTVAEVQHDLASQGFALASDRVLDPDGALRPHLLRTYYDGGALRSDRPDVPADRERARDAVRYRWHRHALTLVEHHTTALVERGGQAGIRKYHRVHSLADPRFERAIRAMLALVPPHRRRSGGTFGINLFRTHTLVVTRPHKDDEEFVVTYVLDRRGEGALSELYHAATGERALTRRLEPGEFLIFEDARFEHAVTPLVDIDDGSGTRRDALVCTVDYPRPD